jgi:hypothetical protein
MKCSIRQLAIEWLCELTWSNIDDPEPFFNDLTDQQIINAIKQYYGGGYRQFIEDNDL